MEGHERVISEYKDFPYTLIGSSCLLSKFNIFLRGDSLKAICKQMRKGEDLRITIYEEKATKFEIVDTHDKYKGKPPKPQKFTIDKN